MKSYRFVIGFLVTFFVNTHCDAAENDRLAGQLLNDSQISGGLVVHLGCGTGDLITGLAAANDAILLHGLDAKPENVRACRNRFQASGFSHRVSVEHWPQEQASAFRQPCQSFGGE